MSIEKRNILEALIFASPDPINENRLIDIIGEVAKDDLLKIIDELNDLYDQQGRAFHIVRGGGGFRFATKPEYGRWVKLVAVGSGRVKLSQASLETLTIIAYKQPITKGDIENIRGVDAGGVLKLLLDRKLIRIAGRSSKPGRSLLYATTNLFLRHFGMDSLKDLPQPEEIVEGGELNMTLFDETNTEITDDDLVDSASQNELSGNDETT